MWRWQGWELAGLWARSTLNQPATHLGHSHLVVKGKDSAARQPTLKNPNSEDWAHFLSVGLSFLIYQMGMITELVSQGCGEN